MKTAVASEARAKCNGHWTIIVALVTAGILSGSLPLYAQTWRETLFWVGRLKDVSPEKRTAVAERAAEQIGKPYYFFDFDLEDVRGFYCSKLAWLSVLLGAGFPPDDEANPKRLLWYSPEQLIKSKHIELIANPGDYGTR